MEYTYETYVQDGLGSTTRKDVCTRYDDAFKQVSCYAGTYDRTEVYKGKAHVLTLSTVESWEIWRESLERAHAWKPEKRAITEVGIFAPHSPLPSHEAHQVVEDDGFTAQTPTLTRTIFETPVNILSDALNIKLKKNPFEFDYKADIETAMKKAESEAFLEMMKEDKIDPPHYQGYLTHQLPITKANVELQWLETMCRIQRYRDNPDEFIAALELQVRKYLDRNGRKDEDLQELQKGLWYYKFMVAYIKNGKQPIFVRDIETILARK